MSQPKITNEVTEDLANLPKFKSTIESFVTSFIKDNIKQGTKNGLFKALKREFENMSPEVSCKLDQSGDSRLDFYFSNGSYFLLNLNFEHNTAIYVLDANISICDVTGDSIAYDELNQNSWVKVDDIRAELNPDGTIYDIKGKMNINFEHIELEDLVFTHEDFLKII